MIGLRIGLGSMAVILSTHMAMAQQTTTQTRPQGRSMGDSAMMSHMRSMDSVDTHLDSLVTQMNATTGDQKMTAMADILNTLVAERRMMRQHMNQMMGHRGMRGNMSGKSGQSGMQHRPSGRDSIGADSAGAGHQP